MSRCGSKCLHETPREAVADEDQVGWLGRVGRFKFTVRRKQVWAHAGSHTYSGFKQKYLQYMSVLSGVPDASCYSTTTAVS